MKLKPGQIGKNAAQQTLAVDVSNVLQNSKMNDINLLSSIFYLQVNIPTHLISSTSFRESDTSDNEHDESGPDPGVWYSEVL